MNLDGELGNDKQSYVVCISVFRDNDSYNYTKINVKITFSKLRYGEMRQYVNFEEMNTECLTEKKWRILITARNI